MILALVAAKAIIHFENNLLQWISASDDLISTVLKEDVTES